MKSINILKKKKFVNKGIYDNIINQQKQYKDAPIIEDENYLSYFNIDRKDIMKIK